MSDQPRDITLEHLAQAMANLAESNAAQGHAITQLLTQINERLASIDTRLAGLNAPAPGLPNAGLEEALGSLRSEVLASGERQANDVAALVRMVEASNAEFAEFRRAVETALSVGWEEIQAMSDRKRRKMSRASSLALLGTALAGLGLLARRRNRGSKTDAV